MRRFLLGIDVGSTTAKVALVDAQKQLQFAEYRRHFAEQGKCVQDLLELVATRYPDAEFKVAVCGSGARPIADLLGLDFVQEVVANSIAIKHLHPEARTAIELGGQDAKVIFFHFDDASRQLIASDMRMNGVCAGGTGAFIDEIAQLLEMPVEEFNAHAERATHIHQVSGRCGVFAKTDIQPLLNQGIAREELALSTLYAVARQTIGGLAQGTTIKAPVVFEGGPLTFNPRLVRAFVDLLGLDEHDVAAHRGIVHARGDAELVDLCGPLGVDLGPTEELGDLLMVILMMCRIAEESGAFDAGRAAREGTLVAGIDKLLASGVDAATIAATLAATTAAGARHARPPRSQSQAATRGTAWTTAPRTPTCSPTT